MLATLSREESERLALLLEPVAFTKNRIIYEVGDPMTFAYFLTKGLVGLMAITDAGQTVDVGMVGKDGFIGCPIILNATSSPCRVMTQAPSEAMRVKREALVAEYDRNEGLQKLLLNHTHAQQIQFIQSAVCHSLHSIPERLCRWLLVISDSLDSDSFDVTQEHIANMLGHQRNRITLAARELLQQRLIEYGGGSMKILDRPGLEAGACECYRIVKESIDQLFAS